MINLKNIADTLGFTPYKYYLVTENDDATGLFSTVLLFKYVKSSYTGFDMFVQRYSPVEMIFLNTECMSLLDIAKRGVIVEEYANEDEAIEDYNKMIVSNRKEVEELESKISSLQDTLDSYKAFLDKSK